ncbi:thioredoxin family protein [Paraburkholderia graminis]|jgi:thioredoxin 1|uniref:thioredoxin family protein n=1 Tax=Paraburkholderia graminis TaxID=60548 RepID=UPI00041307B2|nr:thioredoxin family protein [Paraburkholderia graminis]MDQ0625391.1 thioredoxin 1 [Paraburkholderia graminis]
MAIRTFYSTKAPSRAEVDALPGATVVEFGTDWCGYCQGAQPSIEKAFEAHAGVRHLKIEDGPGRPLGRSFKVKLWPTLIFMRDGAEVARVVRPTSVEQITDAFASL